MSASSSLAEQVQVTLVGDSTVGKSALLASYLGRSLDSYEPTTCESIDTNVLYQNKQVALKLCDASGQDDLIHFRLAVYPGTNVFILCYSTISPYSFDKIKTMWLPEIKSLYPDIPIILVATKIDLRDDEMIQQQLFENGNLKPITTQQGEMLSKELNCIGFVEISNQTLDNIPKPFDIAMGYCLEKRLKESKEKKKDNDTGCNCNIM